MGQTLLFLALELRAATEAQELAKWLKKPGVSHRIYLMPRGKDIQVEARLLLISPPWAFSFMACVETLD